MNFLASYIIYKYNDQSGFFNEVIFGKFSNSSVGSIDFLSGDLLNFFTGLFDPVSGVNLLLIFYTLINILCSYLLFQKLKKGKILALIFSILYSFSIYFIFRAISVTPNLYPLFIFPLTIYLLLNSTRPVYLGILNFLFLCLSSYYAFFNIIIIGLWYIAGKKPLNILKFSAPIIVGIVILFFPYLKQNTYLGNYSNESPMTVYRPLEDWYNLSFRPWYFVIPPKSSVFFGDFSKNLYNKIEAGNYYLADDYMEEEMAGSYMGWHFLLGLGVVAVLLLLKKYKNIEFKTFQNVYKNKEMIIRSFFIIFCILLISGPPSFTIHGVEIYTPTYLLYYIVPVFRTLVRWAVVIYLFVLIINSFLVQDLYNLMKTKFQKILFIVAFLALNFVIFAIKIPVININKPPEEIAFVKEKYPESVPYAVYPKGDYYSIFWIISHEDLLINPVNFINYETGFDSNEFSKNLITEEGIREFLKQNPKYLIYYPEKISDDDLEKINEINPELKSKEDIYEFFGECFGQNIKAFDGVAVFTLDTISD